MAPIRLRGLGQLRCWRRRTGTALVLLLFGITAPTVPALAEPDGLAGEAGQLAGDATPDRVLEPDDRLGAGWRASTDRAVTTVGDATGLHVLVADRRDAYRWRTVATLTEPLIGSDQWIGQACVTDSGRRAVVVYAPRTFTNREVLMERGAFAAVVDLDTGVVSKLAERVTLAYYNPSCGAGETAILSRLERSAQAGEPATTWIGTVDTASAGLVSQVWATGQVSSPVLAGNRLLATKGYAVVAVGPEGELTAVAETAGQPMRLLPETTGGLAFQVARADEVDLVRLVDGVVQIVATVPTGTVKLRPGAGGEVYAVGGRATRRVNPAQAPATWRVVDGLPDSEVSTNGGLLVERAVTGQEAAGRWGIVPDGPQPVRIDAQLIDPTRPDAERWQFEVQPATGVLGGEPTPAVPGLTPSDQDSVGQPDNAPNTDPGTVPWDPDRACAVPRNDPTIQVYQPTPLQVEWAANLAVRGQLTFERPANWSGNGLPAYSPQGYFPPKPLVGGGNVPAQVFLGVLAQESNMWQASWHTVDALAGNPLTSSGFYGIHWEDQDPTTIDWSEVDCGYGAAQVTTGMHSDDTGQLVNGVVMDYTKQKAVVLDYATNVAAGLRILQDKWNQTRNGGLIANNGDPRYIENWWFALWAYNTGFYPNEGSGQPWGVGWSNNPASPLYPADRQMFLTAPLDVPAEGIDDEVGYDNAKHPNHWSYPERVIGFAYTSLKRYDYHSESWEDTYLTAGNAILFIDSQPDRFTFCTVAVNQCDPAAQHPPGDHPGYPPGPCLRDDLMCWWHEPVTWEPDCATECGVEIRRFTTVEPRPLADAIYDSQCSTAGLPPDAIVVDEIGSPTPLGPQGCPRNWAQHGSFQLRFEPYAASGGRTVYPGKVDFHQIGGGFGGHFWFAHTRTAGVGYMKVTGTWQFDQVVNGPARVLVHLPDHGAHTRRAVYEVETAHGTRQRVLSQPGEGNRWKSLGAFMFNGTPQVRLTSVTSDGNGTEDIAFDAIAIDPIPGTYEEHTVEAMALFDENQDIDTDPVSTWWVDTPLRSRQALYDWGLSVSGAVTSLPQCGSEPAAQCAPGGIRDAMQDWRGQVLAAGTDPVNHPAGRSIANWIGFANPHTYRPTGSIKPAHFDTDDGSYKIKSAVEISFVTGPDGRIVEGSEHVQYSHRTGNTHLPEFVMDTFEAIQADYGIPAPALTYTIADLNLHDGAQRTAVPQQTGVLPGRAYAYGGRTPEITDGGTCVAALYVSGGTIGYRPMLGAGGPSDQAAAWVDALASSPAAAPAVRDLAAEIYNMFFKDGATGSTFVQAPPIWQEINVKACAGGQVSTNSGEPLLRASHMPNQYLYHNGLAIDLDGARRFSNQPVLIGNFVGFSNVVDRFRPHPFGWCYYGGGGDGNPWEIAVSIPSDPGINPSVVQFCDGSDPDPEYSS